MSYSTFPGAKCEYTVERLPDVAGALALFEVRKSHPPTTYTIMVGDDTVTCDCPDWQYKVGRMRDAGIKNPQYACKHIKMVAEHQIKQGLVARPKPTVKEKRK